MSEEVVDRISSVTVRRRGIVKAAAWATPAIIVSTAVPAVASSTRAALAFGDSAYIVSACGRLQNVTVHVTTDGAARSGVSVTVTLPSGFTFSGGATSFTAGTNAAGVIVVPEIAVPATPGEVTIQAAATALGLTASVKLTVQPGGGNAYVAVRDGSSSIASVVGVPAGSTPVWGRWFLTPDAHVVDGLSGTVVLSDVAAVSSGFLWGTNELRMGFTRKDGSSGYAFLLGADRTIVPTSGVPNGSHPLWGSWFLTDDGRILEGSGGGVWATDVAETGRGHSAADASEMIFPLRHADGSCEYIVIRQNVPSVRVPVNVPAGSTPLWGSWFLTSTGDVVEGQGGQVLASGVAEAGQGCDWPSGEQALPLRMRDGSLAYMRLAVSGRSVSPAVGVSANARPVWGWWFLDNGNLISGRDGSVIASNVDTYGEGFRVGNNELSLPLRYNASC